MNCGVSISYNDGSSEPLEVWIARAQIKSKPGELPFLVAKLAMLDKTSQRIATDLLIASGLLSPPPSLAKHAPRAAHSIGALLGCPVSSEHAEGPRKPVAASDSRAAAAPVKFTAPVSKRVLSIAAMLEQDYRDNEEK